MNSFYLNEESYAHKYLVMWTKSLGNQPRKGWGWEGVTAEHVGQSTGSRFVSLVMISRPAGTQLFCPPLFHLCNGGINAFLSIFTWVFGWSKTACIWVSLWRHPRHNRQSRSLQILNPHSCCCFWGKYFVTSSTYCLSKLLPESEKWKWCFYKTRIN